jgi:hypothetical protein
MHAVLFCAAWAGLRAVHIGDAIADLRERLHALQDRAMAANKREYLHLDMNTMILRGLLGGQPNGYDLHDIFSIPANDDFWDCPKPIREQHVMSMINYMRAISAKRGPVIRALIATESQSQTGRARRWTLHWSSDVT